MNRLELLNTQFNSQTTAVAELTHVTQAPPDAILSLSIGYKNDKDPRKVNLGIGAYRCAKGKPYVFPVVRKAAKMIVDNHSLDQEYSPIDGN